MIDRITKSGLSQMMELREIMMFYRVGSALKSIALSAEGTAAIDVGMGYISLGPELEELYTFLKI